MTSNGVIVLPTFVKIGKSFKYYETNIQRVPSPGRQTTSLRE
jgi:hypothetical protein